MAFPIKRALLNPILVISGGLTLISGLFLLFSIHSRLIHFLHEYASLVFAAACVLHLVLNWKALLKSMKGRMALWGSMGILVFATLFMGYSTGMKSPYFEGDKQNMQHAFAEKRLETWGKNL